MKAQLALGPNDNMLLKAARMKAPIIVSRTSPTERAISLGHELGITVIGYARNNRLVVFSGEERFSIVAPINK